MKKLILAIILIVAMASVSNAAEYVLKRQGIAFLAMQADSQLIQLIETLKLLQMERASMGADGNFNDNTDFPPASEFQHLSAYDMNVFLGTVAPQFIALYENDNLNRDIMNKVKLSILPSRR